jgi:hypothetical protein
LRGLPYVRRCCEKITAKERTGQDARFFLYHCEALAKHLFDLAEEAARCGRVFEGDGFTKLPKELLLLLGKLRRRLYTNFDDEITFTMRVQVGNAFTLYLDLFAALRAFRDLDDFSAVESFEFDFSTESGLWEADGNDAMEVVAIALKKLVGFDFEHDIKVAAGATEATGIALAGVANAGVRFDAGGNLHKDGVLMRDPAISVAGFAGVADDRAGAGADRAGACNGKEALLRANLSAAATLLAGFGLAPAFRT